MKIFFENWDLFLKFSQFFGYKREFWANFRISEKIETYISENMKIFGYDLNYLIWTPLIHHYMTCLEHGLNRIKL